MMRMTVGAVSAIALFAVAYISVSVTSADDAPVAVSSQVTPDVVQDQTTLSSWSDREICRAAVKTYFFLSILPTDAQSVEGYDGFRSQAGNLYGCAVSGDVTAFRWVNDSGSNMSSRSTRFTLSGSRLTVISDMQREVFTN